MSAKLKLVHPAPKHERELRPYATHYHTSREPKQGDHSRIGRAGTHVGAIRAAVVRITLGEYESANIYGLGGELLYRVRKVGGRKGSVTVYGWFK